MQQFPVGDTTMLVSKIAIICVNPNVEHKIYVTPTRNPNASQWNIGCVGFPGIGACVGHVHFRLFVSISFALGRQRKCGIHWNMGFKIVNFKLGIHPELGS